MQSPCGPGAYPGAYLWQRKKREKERKFNSKNKANNCSGKHYLLEYLVIFCKEPADKKKKKNRGGKLEKLLLIRRTVVPGIIPITSRTLWTTTNKLEAGPAAKGHGNERHASFTCVLLRSCRDVRRPRHLPNAKTAAISQPDPDGTTKKQISYFGDPQTGEVSY